MKKHVGQRDDIRVRDHRNTLAVTVSLGRVLAVFAGFARIGWNCSGTTSVGEVESGRCRVRCVRLGGQSDGDIVIEERCTRRVREDERTIDRSRWLNELVRVLRDADEVSDVEVAEVLHVVDWVAQVVELVDH